MSNYNQIVSNDNDIADAVQKAGEETAETLDQLWRHKL